MFEARLIQGSLLKKIVEAVKDLVSDANLDCTAEGLTMQVRTTSFSWVPPFSPLVLRNGLFSLMVGRINRFFPYVTNEPIGHGCLTRLPLPPEPEVRWF